MARQNGSREARSSPRAHRLHWGVLLVVFALAATACTGHGRANESKAAIPLDAGDLHGTSWVLVATGGSDAVHEDAPLFLAIGDGTASGSGPCNRFHLPFVLHGNDVAAGPVAATTKVCDAAIMADERRYFDALGQVDHAEKDADRLVLTGPGDTRLVFARAESANHLAGTWDVASLATGDAIQSVVAGTRPTFDFHDGGTLTIATGCNTVGVTWEANGTSLTLGPTRTTQKVCSDPAGVMEQESSLVAGLPRVAQAEVTADHTMLLDSDGAIVFILARNQ